MTSKPNRGRISTRTSDFLEEFWIAFKFVWLSVLLKTGQSLSDREVAKRLAAAGGYRAVIAGDVDRIAEERAKSPRPGSVRGLHEYRNRPHGPAICYFEHPIRHEHSLRNCFMEAKAFLNREAAPGTEAYWSDLVRERLGLPRTGTSLDDPNARGSARQTAA
jgi:hypothetical protein